MTQALANETALAEDERHVAGFRAGDEAAFTALLERYHKASIRIAAMYVRHDAAAEEVAQEAWLNVIQGIAQFEGRSSFRTWLFRIVANIAKRRAQRDARTVPFSALSNDDEDAPSLPPDRFRPPTDARWPGHWAQPLVRWDELPEERLASLETQAIVETAIAALPDMQQRVMMLRDVQDCTADETCEILGITEANQRVLLHRARSKVRASLERALGRSP